MNYRTLRKLALMLACGGVLFQAAGCQAQLISIASSLISSYIAEALLSGFLT